ncbi:ATP-binding cassette sub-family C member 9-like isoform X1 [Apostichopus japonicus]|uniref:ATP-binding cassette sub-family C member 9-like isoform X1 n=1 Tax=Stichopus japonicus TaxID=307972 RepID=UPI003AB797DF
MIIGLYSHLTGIPLTPAKAFLALSLLNQLVTPLADFTVYMNVVLNAKVSINRILRFLESPERLMKETSIQGVPNEGDSTSDASNGNTTISEKTPLMSLDSERRTERNFISEEDEDEFVFQLQHGYFCTADETVLLRNVDVTIPRGGLTLLMSSVGSGKSSLLLALIEELTLTAGVYKGRHNLSSVAYCPQRADILNATLRENILFGRPYDERRYKGVIEACCLLPHINILPALDETEIGERGINLSGGQKQRLSLARAIYSDKQTLLLLSYYGLSHNWL